MACHIMMYKKINYERTTVMTAITDLPPPIGSDSKDDVFAVPSESDDVKDLNERFKQMMAGDPCESGENIKSQTHQKLSYSLSLPHSTSTVNQNFSSEFPHHVAESSDCAEYASQTARASVIEGIHTIRRILTLPPQVPRILIDHVPYGAQLPCGCMERELTQSKIMARHRKRIFSRPYRSISHRHYTAPPHSLRRRRFGVSQRGSTEPSVNELSKLMANLGTDDAKSNQFYKETLKTPLHVPQQRLPAMRHEPSLSITNAKEKSRSLSDLGFNLVGSSHSTDSSSLNSGYVKQEGCTNLAEYSKHPFLQALYKMNNLDMSKE